MGLVEWLAETTLGTWIKAHLAMLHTAVMIAMLVGALTTTAWATHRVDALIAQGKENAVLKAKQAALDQALKDKKQAEDERDALSLELEYGTDDIHNDAAKHQHEDEVENAKPAYTNCKLPDDGLLRLNQRIDASNQRRKAAAKRDGAL